MHEDNDGDVRLQHLPVGLLTPLLAARPVRRLTTRQRERLEVRAEAWPGIADDAERHVVALLIARRLDELGLTTGVPEGIRARWKADARHARLQHAVQERGALRISAELTRHGLRHAFLKGFAYRLMHYRPAWVRLGGDLDLLVDRHNVEPVRRVMQSLGFTQAACSTDYQDYRPARQDQIWHTESQHHEMVQFVRNVRVRGDASWLLAEPFRQRVPFAFEALPGGRTVHCCVDIHWALHFSFADAEPLRTVHLVDVPGTDRQVPVLDNRWNLLFTAFKLYVEAFDRPRFGFAQLADLIALCDSGPDWDAVARLSARYDLDAALFYTLAAAGQIAGRPLVPDGHLDRWARPSDQPTATPAGGFGDGVRLDVGDFTPQLIGERVPGRFLQGPG